MKVIFYLCFFLISMNVWSQANDNVSKTDQHFFSVFVDGGATVIHSQYYHSSSKMGYQFGAGASLLLFEMPDFNFNTQLSIQLYNGVSELHSSDVIYQLDQTLYTLQQAFYMQYNKYKWQPKAGVFIAKKLYGQYTYQVELNNNIIYTNTSDGDTFNNYQIGFFVGVEKAINRKWIIELNYQYLESHETLHALQAGIRMWID